MTTTADLESLLTAHEGDVFSPETLAGLDEREEFPDEAVRVLDDAGLPAHYVLPEDGDFAETVRLLRAVARRDLTVAIAHGKTFLGAAPVWVAGTPAQATRLAAHVRAGEPVCWGLTERDHGADLLAGELTATPHETGDEAAGGGVGITAGGAGAGDGGVRAGAPGGWRLTGEKWLINNATRAALACVLARTDPAGGARGFSLFLVDRRELPDGTWRSLPKVRTHGIRGADISGFTLDGAPVPADALVGEEGDGIPVVLKTLQLTRVACAALSLGAADHALGLARDFAAGRELYGRRLADVPHVRRILGRAAAAALTAEAVGLLSARSVHTLPGELSAISAITKAYVPTLTQETLGSLGELLGVRGFLTSPPGGGFAKLERDHRICAVFDGSTAVNRAALLNQLPRLTRQLSRRRTDGEGLRSAADLTAPLPPFDPARLTLLSVTGCSAVQALPDLAARARTRTTARTAPLLDRLLVELARLEAESADFLPVACGLPSTAFRLAEAYERAYAAAACLLLWLENPTLRTGRLGADDLWLRACLTTLLGENGGEEGREDDGEEGREDDGEEGRQKRGQEGGDVFDALAEVVLQGPAPEFTLSGGAA
ncbi:acyl-CoA dehydrogenase [Streptomyces caniscabiei]|uniref:Acyl-CoA dehydrogenase n=1 Tax=Streptomyces caniscabiei TaxID=2746961 RepID=A0A927QHN2_9ACTN|nr:acyl-CoA dehydrogenase [Streptomyces caniscabiei]MBD9727468.1 acyl-CoA dehydrogenase [Streptomyces caniscabiei]MDX3512643.1 acyl-CoA dehydrogenase [Streptomyces caniscabiei]MDX3722168.1 acyl-CoA dehydrogenase [Streptomyces caniscabiei]WEO28849.1 acyl-CoA dehydrogenase [Streptomyces caniscabiei]